MYDGNRPGNGFISQVSSAIVQADSIDDAGFGVNVTQGVHVFFVVNFARRAV